jgi:hypothetical protein
MKSTKTISQIEFTAIARLTRDNKSAGVVALLAIDASEYGQVSLTNKSIVEATGMDKKNVSLAIRFLQDRKFLLNDPHADKVYHINNNVLRLHSTRDHDGHIFPDFSSKIQRLPSVANASRDRLREVKRMNKLSDAQIAEAEFGSSLATESV